jgi:hypothetical protein
MADSENDDKKPDVFVQQSSRWSAAVFIRCTPISTGMPEILQTSC